MTITILSFIVFELIALLIGFAAGLFYCAGKDEGRYEYDEEE